MVLKKVLKISEFSLERLEAYAETHKLVPPDGVDERKFYIDELIKLNQGEDNIGCSIDSSKYKGVNSCVCSVCGEEKGVRPDVYAKRIEKFGTEERLKKEYKCRECRKK